MLDLNLSDIDKRHETSVCIMFQNIQFFGKENRRVVANDFGYEQADIILLVECHNLTSHRAEVEKVFKNTHDLIHFTAVTENFCSNGQVCYVRKNEHKNRMRFLAHNANDFNMAEETKIR